MSAVWSWRSGFAAVCAVAGVLGQLPEAGAAATVTLHYAPAEDLEAIDLGLIRAARRSIDLAAFALTDAAIIEALASARARGVALRIVLDPSQNRRPERLASLASVVRVKPPGPYMHLKAYAIDGSELRTGSANLSRSGLRRQDNDLLVIQDRARTLTFERTFAELWNQSVPLGGIAGITAGKVVSSGSTGRLRPPHPLIVAARGLDGPARTRTARCRDGATSGALTHRGACSRHGGVALWYR